MKWFSIGCVCYLATATLTFGDPATDVYNRAAAELANNEFDKSAEDFSNVFTNYPSTANADDARLRAGLSYLYGGKLKEAVDTLTKLVAPDAKPQYRGPALYFTALAQFSQGQKGKGQESTDGYTNAVKTLTTLIDLITKSPTPDTKDYLETGIYYRALANFELKAYPASEKDLLDLTTLPQYAQSLTRPDYLLRLGGLYAQQANAAVSAETPDVAAIQSLAGKSIAAYDLAIRDPNALVQANDANMSKAQVLFLVAQLDPSGTGYQKALEAFRLVRRKADLIPAEQDRIQQLTKQMQDLAQKNPGSLVGAALEQLIKREQDRLKDLLDPNSSDPIIQAMINMAQCYVTLKQPDEARTILRRLVAHAKLDPDQQQTVDFQLLYSYVLGGQTDAADKALTDYLSKHAGDPKVDSISYSIAIELSKRGSAQGISDTDKKMYLEGELKQLQRSLNDFPAGKSVEYVIQMQADVLNKLGRGEEADKVISTFIAAHPNSPVVNTIALTQASRLMQKGDLEGAAAAYKQVRDNAVLPEDTRAAAGAGFIQALNQQQKFDDVITEVKTYQEKFPKSAALPTVLLFEGIALDHKNDPGAAATMQDIARKYPDSESAPIALSYVISIYAKSDTPQHSALPQMTQAYADLLKGYPTAYPSLEQAADLVCTAMIKAKSFEQAAALYKPLLNSPKPEVVAAAQNKIGDVWLASAKTIHYQSLPVAQRPEAEGRLAKVEAAYLDTLKSSSDQLSAVGDAFEGLVNATKIRRSWNLVKQDSELEASLDKTVGPVTGELAARLELAKAGLVFIIKDGSKQFPAALDRMKKVVADNAGLKLTRQETNHYGDLLIAAKDYPTAEKAYNELLQNASPTDRVSQADGNFGLGASALAQGKIDDAKAAFLKMINAAWHPRIAEAKYGIALANEKSTNAADLAAAKQTYQQLIQQGGSGGVTMQAKAMLGYSRLLDKSGNGIKPAAEGANESAVKYDIQPDTLFGPATPQESAEGLYQAAVIYQKAGDVANAKIMTDKLKNYSASAPDWANKPLQ